eukprot:m.265917 g.265917  ORF g.265917 m.265917 type:complete len:985 (-) comp64348_c0_seq1:78-3032(-)
MDPSKGVPNAEKEKRPSKQSITSLTSTQGSSSEQDGFLLNDVNFHLQTDAVQSTSTDKRPLQAALPNLRATKSEEISLAPVDEGKASSFRRTNSADANSDTRKLRIILRTEQGLAKLEQYLSNALPAEKHIPTFWYHCEQHKKLRLQMQDALSLSALEICVEHVADSAVGKVNISESLARQLVENANDASPEFFLRAQQELFWRLHELISAREGSLAVLESLGSGSLRFQTREFEASKFNSKKKVLHKALSASDERMRNVARKWRRKARSQNDTQSDVGSNNGAAVNGTNNVDVLQGVNPFAKGLGLVVHSYIWGYDDNAVLSISQHRLRRKLSQQQSKDLTVRAKVLRSWTEEQQILWTPSNRSHDGLKRDLLAANKVLSTSTGTFYWSAGHGSMYALCREGVVLYFQFQRGSPIKVTLNDSLQKKVAEFGGIKSIARTQGSARNCVAVSFLGSATIGQIRFQNGLVQMLAKARASKEFHKHWSSVNLHSSTDRSSMKKRGGGRMGSEVTTNIDNTLAVTWWPRTSVDPVCAENFLLYSVTSSSTSFQPTQCALQATRTEILGVFWGFDPKKLYLLGLDQAQHESVVTLKSFQVNLASQAFEADLTRQKNADRHSYMRSKRTSIFDDELDLKAQMTVTVTGAISTQAFTPVGDLVLIVSQGGQLVILDLKTEETEKATASIRDATAAVWHPEGALVLVAAAQRVYCFDVMLAPVWVGYADDMPQMGPFIDLDYSAEHCSIKSIVWLLDDSDLPPVEPTSPSPSPSSTTPTPTTSPRPSSSSPSSSSSSRRRERARASSIMRSHTIVVEIVGAPVIMVTFLAPQVSNGSLALPWTIRGRLATDQGTNAARLLSRLQWSENSATCFGLLAGVINHFLKRPFSPQNNETIRQAFPPMAWHIADVKADHFTMWDERIRALQRRYFTYLLSHRKLVIALDLATELRSREMCQALSVAASAIEGDRASFVATIANQAVEMISPSSVSFV